MSAPTRRTVLAGLSAAGLAVPALAALPAIAEGHQDAELFRIVHEFEDARAAWKVADNHADKQFGIARKEYPQPPRSISREVTRLDGRKAFVPISNEEIEATHWARDDEENESIRQARLVDRAAYDAPCRIIDKRYGVPEAKARAKTALTEYTEAEGCVYETPAKTADGIAAKLRVLISECNLDDPEIESVALILTDAERLGRVT